MNRCFRVVWNAANAAWQAVAEIAPAGGKTKSSSRLQRRSAALIGAAALAVAVPGSWAQSLPTGGNIVAGSGSIATSGSTMTITQNTAKLAADWQSFNIGQGNTVNFVQPSASAIALNRVLGSDVSVIQGAINANGQVFLLNPNGVLFTPTAQVNVGGIVASTLSLSTSDFLAGNYNFAGTSSNAVVNQGNITAVGDGGKGGTIALMAAKITNDGNLTANGGNVLLGAGSEVTLDLGGPVKLQVKQGAIDALVQNGGAIQAAGGLVYLTAQAVNELTSATINNTGVIRAQTLTTGEKGEIRLMADMKTGTVHVGGTLDASAPNGGNGGFIETSGAVFNVGDTAVVTTRAVNGATGTWLIDPDVLEIVASGGGSIPGVGVGTSQISTSTLNTALGSNNVNLQANNWINFKTAFTYSGVSDATLGLYAPTIMLGGDIATDTNKLSLNFGGTYASVNYSGDVYVYGGDRSITTKGGDVTFNGNLGSDYDSVNARNRNLTVNTQSVTTSGKITHKGLVNGGFNVIASQTGDLSFTLSGLSNKWVNFEFSTGTIHVYTDATKGTEVTKIGADVWPLTMVVGGSQLSGGVDIPAGTVMNLNATFGATGTVYFMDGTSSTFTMNNGSGGNAGWTPATALTNVARIEYLGQNSSAAPYNFPGVTYNTTGPAGKLNNYVARGGVAQVDNSIAVNGGITFESSRFVNNVGLTALQPGAGKFWQVWSTNTDPYNATTGDVMGGLAYAFKQYGATYGTTAAAEAGSGYLLTYAPTVSLGISGTTSKVYDGTTTATVSSASLTAGGAVTGSNDVITGVTSASVTGATYRDNTNTATANVTSAVQVSASVTGGTITATETLVSGATVAVYGYAAAATANGTGSITSRPLGIAVNAAYNGTGTFGSSALSFSPTATGTGLVSGQSITEVTINSKDVADNSTNYVKTVTGSGGFLLSNYKIGGTNGLTDRTADAVGTVLGNTNNTVTLGKAALGVKVEGTYNGTTGYTASASTTITTNGLVNGETLTGVTLADADVYDNATNKVTAFTAGTASLANYAINGDRNTATSGGNITTAHNSVALVAAPLGVTVSGTYNGTATLTTAGGATITTDGLVGQDTQVGSAVTSATLNSKDVLVADKVVSLSGTGTFDLRNYAINGSVNATPSVTAGATGDGSDATNTATLARLAITVEADDKSKKTGESDPTLTYQIISGNLIGDDSLGSLNRNAGENPGQYTINATALANGNYAITAIDGVLTVISDFLPPPPPSPIIVPAFVDNGSAVLANQSITSFGGLNYVLSGSSLTSVSSAGSSTSATGGAQQTTSATSSQNAVTSSTSSGDGATQGLSGTGGEQTGQDASFLNFVASNNSGDGAQGNGNEGGDRKSASELNVNNVTVPSSTGPLDVFVVETGINLQRIAQLRGLTN
jgi:filamentous hemagglutinin family protein